MKKLSMLMAFMLTALVASAQSLVGSWVTDLGDNEALAFKHYSI